jgi:transposase
MNRHDLTNTQWERLQSLLPPQKPHIGCPAIDHRRILRERIERLINRLKQHRRLATRYEKCAVNYHAMWLIAATLL